MNRPALDAPHLFYVNFARPHKSPANPYLRTPAMAAGIADHVWTLEEMAALLDLTGGNKRGRLSTASLPQQP